MWNLTTFDLVKLYCRFRGLCIISILPNSEMFLLGYTALQEPLGI
jgi:hypothetical protein